MTAQMPLAKRLVAVLHSRPLGDGIQTLRRVELATKALDCTTYTIANLYPTQLANIAALEDSNSNSVWRQGRDEIGSALALSDTTDVLLGYGVKLPSGPQRKEFRNQLEWLGSQLGASNIRVWTFGDRPAHPSRWQRVAYRHAPGSTVEELAAELIQPHSLA